MPNANVEALERLRGVLVVSDAVLTDKVCERVVHGGPEGYEGDWEAT